MKRKNERARLQAKKRREEEKCKWESYFANPKNQNFINEARAKVAAARQAYKDEMAKKGESISSNRIFDTRLRYMRKAELQELCRALGLDEEGMVTQLLVRIDDKFEAEPELKDNERFAGIFPQKRRKLND